MRTYRDQSIILTGASSGIGLELARLLAAEGARLAIVSRRRARLDTIADELGQRGASAVHVCAADLAVSADCDRVVDESTAALGPVDVLINNAGLGEMGRFDQIDAADLQNLIDVHVSAIVRLCRRVAPAMAARGSGQIVNIASGAAFAPIPYMSVYAASKSFVLMFSEALRGELKSAGVGVTCVCPGVTRTSFFQRGGLEGMGGLLDGVADSPEWAAAATLRAMRCNRMTRVLGVRHAISCQLPRLFPRTVVLSFMASAMRRMVRRAKVGGSN
jgi:hypothetical protein